MGCLALQCYYCPLPPPHTHIRTSTPSPHCAHHSPPLTTPCRPSAPHHPPAGRYAFVELRTEELATTAMTLDKTELCGRQMNIGRPKGYVPGSGGGWVRRVTQGTPPGG